MQSRIEEVRRVPMLNGRRAPRDEHKIDVKQYALPADVRAKVVALDKSIVAGIRENEEMKAKSARLAEHCIYR